MAGVRHGWGEPTGSGYGLRMVRKRTRLEEPNQENRPGHHGRTHDSCDQAFPGARAGYEIDGPMTDGDDQDAASCAVEEPGEDDRPAVQAKSPPNGDSRVEQVEKLRQMPQRPEQGQDRRRCKGASPLPEALAARSRASRLPRQSRRSGSRATARRSGCEECVPSVSCAQNMVGTDDYLGGTCLSMTSGAPLDGSEKRFRNRTRFLGIVGPS